MKRAMVLLLLCLLSSSVAFAGKKPPRSPAPASTPAPTQAPALALVWTKVGTVGNVTSNYTPVVQLGGSQIRAFSNSNGVTDGNLYLRVGSWSDVGSASQVLKIDSPRDDYIRTSAVVQGASGKYYAILYTGDGYPTQGGYSPSWTTSPDGYNWTWHGPIGIFGRNQSSAAALVVDESRTDDYRFMAWIDLWGGLTLMHSADGTSWSSDLVNVWPFPNEQPQFVTAAKTLYGYHLIGANAFPATALRHVFSCTGFPPWQVLETASPVLAGSTKGTNLVYDAPNDLLHALTSGVHFTSVPRPHPCQ